MFDHLEDDLSIILKCPQDLEAALKLWKLVAKHGFIFTEKKLSPQVIFFESLFILCYQTISKLFNDIGQD
jgi:hypothetical protein